MRPSGLTAAGGTNSMTTRPAQDAHPPGASADLKGAINVGGYFMTDDGSAHVYDYFKHQTQLFLVDGVP
jgi:hypothetical protein